MVNLFKKERFVMHAGGVSDFKLECDALIKKDYETLGFLVSRKYSFKLVRGVPRGGLPFESALKSYEDPSASSILIVDDVLTTGTSMVDYRKKLIAEEGFSEGDIKGLVIFSRGELLPWVDTIFSLNKNFWQND